MARGVNKVILIGNLGNEPEVRYTPGGSAVASVSLATSETWRDKQSGELQDRTEWHRVVFFNRLAEIVGEYLHKGSKIYVDGSLRTRKWQDKTGVDRYTTEIIANEMHMLDNRTGPTNGSSSSSAKEKFAPSMNEAYDEPVKRLVPSINEAHGEPVNSSNLDMRHESHMIDDDIPF